MDATGQARLKSVWEYKGWENFKIEKIGGYPSFHFQSPPAPPFPHVRNLATTRFLGTTRLRYFIRSPSIQVVTSIPDCLLFGSSVNTHAVEHWARAYGFEGVRNFIGVPVFIEPARGAEKLTPRGSKHVSGSNIFEGGSHLFIKTQMMRFKNRR